MKTYFVKVLLLLPFMAFLFSACDPLGIRGEGQLIDELRNPGAFNRLHLAVPGKATIVRDSIFLVEVRIQESLSPYLETEVRNGQLDIYFSRNVFHVNDLELVIHAPDFVEINVSGSAELVGHDLIEGQELEIDVSGSGSVTLDDIHFDKVHADLSGSGRIAFAGMAEDLEAWVSGSGKIDALDCPVKTADLHISGSGQIYCHVSDFLKASMSGSGMVWYDGNPQLDVSTSGSGKVKKR